MVYKKIEQKHYEPPHRLKAINMFCCGGINEFYLSDIGVDVVAAVEISKFRAMFHSKLYPKCRVVVGDITRQKVEDKLVEIAHKEKPEILLASPVCQEYCGANLYKDANSPRLYLFENVLTHLRRCPSYKYCVIENAKEFKKAKVKKLGEVCVSEHIKSELEKLGFKYVKIGIQDAADFGAPMMRNRTIIIASKEKDVDLPVALIPKHITYGEMSADLDPIDAGEYSEIEYYTPSKLPECQIEQLRQTPSGERVKNPKTAKGNLSKCRFAGSYHRLKNEDVMHSALTNNGEISGFFTIPPAVEAADENGKKYFKNCRTLTLLEMFRGFGLPDNMPLPEYSKANERFVRELLGEAWNPLHCQAVIYEFVKAEFDLEPLTKDSFFETDNDFFTIAAEHTTKCWERVNPNAYFNINAFKIMFICEGIDFALHYLGQTQGFFNLKAKVSQQTEMEKSCFGLAAHYARNRLIERGYCTDCDLKSLTDMFKKNGLVFTQLYIRYVRSEEEILNIFSKAKTYKGGD